ncbi:TetR/AcrR family transcriptional regulator [Listeria monocytogenes]|uniref:TetR/AcrR family transcriptional regulator n=1 Tax=Listeria monocytogenes TaxID=1639 RepID=UPI00188C6A0D|nr:TetR/AcrR family transcriptional regulator [Listeria monocytogenes]EIL7854719.1 TetR/AcrR family transcriptional regulator [Listeria monocytogenes]EIN1823926.1 TetR/AcrR family transcriptional regulator [Listeria monocytogenes]EIN1824819.1 TetR/AcrR family transcriptional regulator [Listeria monocytogenes]EIN1839236.1 TetR/AcrR family transcriptional regulator [Listeria monocytogenes]EIN1841068.1 TetR/AcrR family transcriptional regulator [Listeria monocytogenes]
MDAEGDIIRQMLDLTEKETKMSEKQRRIVAASIELFAEKGYAGTSTNEIAKKAGVAEGTIFRHYKTKKDLLMAITMPTLIGGVIPFLAQSFVKEVFESEYPDFQSFIREIIVNRFNFAKENGKVIKIYFMELFYHDELRIQFSEIFMTHVKGQFDQMIDYYKERGEIVDMPNSTIMRALITNIVGFMLTRFVVMPDVEWDDAKEIDDTVAYIMRGLGK